MGTDQEMSETATATRAQCGVEFKSLMDGKLHSPLKRAEEHSDHIKGGYFQKGCESCERFVGKYIMSGRKFKEASL